MRQRSRLEREPPSIRVRVDAIVCCVFTKRLLLSTRHYDTPGWNAKDMETRTGTALERNRPCNVICIMHRSVYIAAPVAAALALNALIAIGGLPRLRRSGAKKSAWLPPGPVIGAVWLVILGLLGNAMWLSRDRPIAFWSLAATAAWCLAYPLITGLRKSALADVASLIVSFSAATVVAGQQPSAMPFVAPLLVWVSYVNVVGGLC